MSDHPPCPNCGIPGESDPSYDHLELLRCENINCTVFEFYNRDEVER